LTSTSTTAQRSRIRVDGRADVGAPADVAAQREDLGAHVAQLGAGAREFRFVAGQQAQPRALGRELARQHESQPPRPAGDDDDAPREVDGMPAAGRPAAGKNGGRPGGHPEQEPGLVGHSSLSSSRRSVTASRGACPPTSLLK
jgi:hypothetical protein